jgi:hypothetical protein
VYFNTARVVIARSDSGEAKLTLSRKTASAKLMGYNENLIFGGNFRMSRSILPSRFLTAQWARLALCLLSLTIHFSPAQAAAADATPAEVYSLAQQILGDIELVRFEMGIPKTALVPIKVTGVSPWESFQQARLLYEKTNQLAFEFTRHKAPDISAPPARDIKNADVLKALEIVRERVMDTKKALGITGSAKIPPAGPVTGDDVFLTLVIADKVAHQCLLTPIAPMLAYQRVTLAVGYASRLLELFPDAGGVMPNTPPYERGKIPGDAFFRLNGCLKLIEQIAAKSGVKIMKLDVRAVEREKLTPADAQNMAAIIIAELSYLHSLQKNAKPVRQAIYPGRKFPSLVYQRAGILEAQLTGLLRKVSKSPRWLDGVFNR